MPDMLPVEEARRHLGDLVTRAAAEGTVTMITKHGIPAAAIVPPQHVESMREPAWTIADLRHELKRCGTKWNPLPMKRASTIQPAQSTRTSATLSSS